MGKGRDGGEKKKLEKNGGKKEKTDDYSGHYVIASGWPPERRPLERRTLVPICCFKLMYTHKQLDQTVFCIHNIETLNKDTFLILREVNLICESF